MLSTLKMFLHTKVRGAVSITLMLLVFATFVGACIDPGPPPSDSPTVTPEPTPTATSAATPTPLPPTPTTTTEPTPTPPPTATPESAPDATMPEPDAGSVEDLVITESTTVGDLMAVLSKDEVSCMRDLFGADAFDALQGMSLAFLPDSADLPLECLAPESAVGISVAMMSSAAGGFSAETRACIAALATEAPALIGLGEPPEDSPALIGRAIQMSLCLTEEEAAALGVSTLEESSGAELLNPTTARCLVDQLGGEDVLMKISSGDLDDSAMPVIFAAALACDLETGGAPPPPDDILVWQYETGNPGEFVIVSPTLATGVLYAGSYDGFVYALDAATGELLWRFEADGLSPPPTVAEGVVYAIKVGEGLWGLDALTGEVLSKDERIYEKLLLSDRTLYFPILRIDGDLRVNVRAIDESSGGLKWEAEVPRSSMLPLLFPLTASGRNVYVSDDYQVHALDSTTGKLAWSFDAGDVVQAPPGASDGVVYLRSYSAAYALDESTGEQLWRYDVESGGFGDRPPFIVDGVLALVDEDRAMQGLDADTGQVLWSYEDDYVIFISGVANGMVFVTGDEAFHALDAATGKEIWHLDSGWALAEVTVVDGVLYANSLDGYLHTFDARTGEPFWSVEIGYHLGGADKPYVVSGGVVYVAYQLADSGVYAFTAPGGGR